MIGFLGPEDILIVVLLAAVLFGAKKIPELARSLGQAKGEFHKGMKDSDSVPAKSEIEPVKSGGESVKSDRGSAKQVEEVSTDREP